MTTVHANTSSFAGTQATLPSNMLFAEFPAMVPKASVGPCRRYERTMAAICAKCTAFQIIRAVKKALQSVNASICSIGHDGKLHASKTFRIALTPSELLPT